MVGSQGGQLPVSVGGVYHIAINNGHFANASTGYKLGGIRTHAPKAHHHYMFFGEITYRVFAHQQTGTA
jgi:hypothetical protein